MRHKAQQVPLFLWGKPDEPHAHASRRRSDNFHSGFHLTESVRVEAKYLRLARGHVSVCFHEATVDADILDTPELGAPCRFGRYVAVDAARLTLLSEAGR
jgi:hypothetical protein